MRLNLAERILNQDVLSKDEALALFEDETIDTFELLNEHISFGNTFREKVKLNMILNAKSGICSEDCGYCGQSVKMKENNAMR